MKKILSFFIVFFIIILIICFIFFRNQNLDGKENKLSNSNNQFVINNIHYYSNANAINNNTSYQNPELNLNVYQYSDVEIYLDRLSSDVTEKNYITNVSISDININSKNQKLYYLTPLMFGNSDLNSNGIVEIKDNLEYNVINTTNSKNEQNYNIPIYFQDCSNPITLRLVNTLMDNYKVSSEQILLYNGSLIKELGIDLKKINTNIKFNLEVTTKDGEKRMKLIELNIPLENKDGSILDGDFEIEENESIEF